MLRFALICLAALLPGACLAVAAPASYRGMLPNGKPFIATMYYERYYNFPEEYPLMDRDLADIAARGWTVCFTDYTILSLGPIWDRYYDTSKRLGTYVLPDQWNSCLWADDQLMKRLKPPVTDNGGAPAGFAPCSAQRFADEIFASTVAESESKVISRYLSHPAYIRITGVDGKLHPLMIVIYETGMCDYNGSWIDYSDDTRAKWIDFQKKRIGKVIAEQIPKPSQLDQKQALVLWNEFRAEYLSDGWCAVSRELKKRFPDLYTMVIYRQHGLLEGSRSGGGRTGIGRRAIRPELWKDFDIVGTEHDGDDGLEYVLADADIVKSAAKGRIGVLEYYLDSGYKSWTARPVEHHRPWTQSEMLGSCAVRGLLPMHYGYNERDDRAGIASLGRREKDAPLWHEAVCNEAADANKAFAQAAPYMYAASPAPARAAIVLPYEAYALAHADDLPLDRRLVAISKTFQDKDIPVDWVFSSSSKIAAYRVLVVPEAPYSADFEKAVLAREKSGTKIIRLSMKPDDSAGLEALATELDNQAPKLRASRLPAKPGIETAALSGKGYRVEVIVNHTAKETTYTVKGQAFVFPAASLTGTTLTVPAHSSVYRIGK